MTCTCQNGFIRRPHRRDDAFAAEPCRECHPLPEREDAAPEVVAQLAMVEALLLARQARIGGWEL